jgi:hypothetical protein
MMVPGIGLIVDDEGILRCQIQLGKARRLIAPGLPAIPEVGEVTDETSDDEEIRAFAEEIADLLFDMDIE